MTLSKLAQKVQQEIQDLQAQLTTVKDEHQQTDQSYQSTEQRLLDDIASKRRKVASLSNTRPNRGCGTLVTTRRLIQLLLYATKHQTGFYRREMASELEMSEATSERWLAALEEVGLVWRWRRHGNDAYLWRPTFTIKWTPDRLSQARRPEQ